MRKHGGTPSRRDKQVTPAAISPPGVARGRFVGGQQSGLAGCKAPLLFARGTSSCSSQGQRKGERRGASPRPSAPTYLPSAGALGYGSAATLFFPNGSRWVLCQTSPYQSSEESEFLAAIMFLRWALASHPHLTLAVLGDNLHVIDAFPWGAGHGTLR